MLTDDRADAPETVGRHLDPSASRCSPMSSHDPVPSATTTPRPGPPGPVSAPHSAGRAASCARSCAPRPLLLGAALAPDGDRRRHPRPVAATEGHPVRAIRHRERVRAGAARPRLRLPVGTATAHCDRRRRHLRQRGPARHLEDRAHPLRQPRPSCSGPRPSPPPGSPSSSLVLLGGLHHRLQPAHRRPPAPDRAVRPDHPGGRGAPARRRELGHHGCRRCSASPAWPSCSRSGPATRPSASPHPS